MRRKHRRLQQEADLDITAFMNLMIVLVPILLINMIFAHTTVLELNFPEMDGSTAEQAETLQLQVIILDDQLVVSDNKGGVIKQVPNIEGPKGDSLHDFALLAKVMQDIKSRVPEKKDVTIMAKQHTSYQTLVTVMDTVRSFQTVVAGSLVHAELFPEISIADAPNIVPDAPSAQTDALLGAVNDAATEEVGS